MESTVGCAFPICVFASGDSVVGNGIIRRRLTEAAREPTPLSAFVIRFEWSLSLSESFSTPVAGLWLLPIPADSVDFKIPSLGEGAV